MGTRNLTMVIVNKETKVAQYGQWDGYPDGQGVNILQFLKESSLDDFKIAVKGCSFVSKEEYNDITAADRIPVEFSRDTASDILSLILVKGIRKLYDSSAFAYDGLFCEWCYVIDLDTNTFEVYEGFTKEPLVEGERFYKADAGQEVSGTTYYPVKLVASFPLSKLPTEEEFKHTFEEEG